MKHLTCIVFFAFSCSYVFGQNTGLNPDLFKPNHEKEIKFLPYITVRHGGESEIDLWKKNNTVQYYKELWYFSESFYVRRNVFTDGITMDEGMIDISRFEAQRKSEEEAVVVMPGFKDVIVLLPEKKLIYKP